jgi:hypothetical protein
VPNRRYATFFCLKFSLSKKSVNCIQRDSWHSVSFKLEQILFYSFFASDMFVVMDINTIIEDRKMSSVQKICQGVAVVAITSTLFAGCSQVVKTGANVALGFTEKHIVPPILAMEDAEMVCNSGNSLTPAIMATKDMGADPTRVAVLMYSAAGICAEQKALDAELRYLRASKANQVPKHRMPVLSKSVGRHLLHSVNIPAINYFKIVLKRSIRKV